MKYIIFLLLPLLLLSCTKGIGRGGNASERYEYIDPCKDPQFVALKDKKMVDMTASEYEFFRNRYAECEGVPLQTTNAGNAPEWIVAVLMIIGALLSVAVVVK